MANATTPIAVSVDELSDTPQQPETQTSASSQPGQSAGAQPIPVDVSELQTEHEYQTSQPTALTPATTPLSAKPIPDQPGPSRQRQEFLRRTGGGSTTEQGVSEANKTAAITGAGIVASEGTDAVLGKLLGPTVKMASKGTGILDEAGNEIMREVETKGPSLAKQGMTKAVEAVKPLTDLAKAHPIISTVSASVLEGLAHELGIDPFELAKKAIKFGGYIVE